MTKVTVPLLPTSGKATPLSQTVCAGTALVSVHPFRLRARSMTVFGAASMPRVELRKREEGRARTVAGPPNRMADLS
jgi:hypothetical protein